MADASPQNTPLDSVEQDGSSTEGERRFLVEMSRELRHDLGIITAYLELLRRQSQMPEQHQHIDVATAAAHRLASTLNASVDYARATSGHIAPRDTSFSLKNLVREVVAESRLEARQREVDIHLDYDNKIRGRLRGDSALLGECMSHVLHNAVRCCRTSATLSIRYTDGHLEATVSDDGTGVPVAYTEQVFLPFTSLTAGDEGRARAGLGLALAKAYTELMGGRIAMSPNQPKGTEVTMRWPLTAVDSWRGPDSVAPSSMHDGLVSDLPPSSIIPLSLFPVSDHNADQRLLVVDDDKDLRAVLEVVLETMGVPYDCAENGEVALALLRAGEFTGVIMDMQMPVMDGYEAIGAIRSDPKLHRLKVLALTARALRHEKEACLAAGCDLYQAKPASFERLSRSISALLALGSSILPPKLPRVSIPPPPSMKSSLATIRQRYQTTFPDIELQLQEHSEGVRDGDANAMEKIRIVLHRVGGTAGSMYFTSLGEAATSACTTVRALQRAYPEPRNLPPESKQALTRAIRHVVKELTDPVVSLPEELDL